MGYDYSTKLNAIGQPDSMGCWYTCISWWLKAMAVNSKRRALDPLEVYTKFQSVVGDGWNKLGGGLSKEKLIKIGKDQAVRMTFDFHTPETFKTKMAIDVPVLVIFNYPGAGGTHMNALFNQTGDEVWSMEPYYPLSAEDGKRTGKYIKRKMSFFTTGAEVGVGYCPLGDKGLEG